MHRTSTCSLDGNRPSFSRCSISFRICAGQLAGTATRRRRSGRRCRRRGSSVATFSAADGTSAVDGRAWLRPIVKITSAWWISSTVSGRERCVRQVDAQLARRASTACGRRRAPGIANAAGRDHADALLLQLGLGHAAFFPPACCRGDRLGHGRAAGVAAADEQDRRSQQPLDDPLVVNARADDLVAVVVDAARSSTAWSIASGRRRGSGRPCRPALGATVAGRPPRRRIGAGRVMTTGAGRGDHVGGDDVVRATERDRAAVVQVRFRQASAAATSARRCRPARRTPAPTGPGQSLRITAPEFADVCRCTRSRVFGGEVGGERLGGASAAAGQGRRRCEAAGWLRAAAARRPSPSAGRQAPLPQLVGRGTNVGVVRHLQKWRRLAPASWPNYRARGARCQGTPGMREGLMRSGLCAANGTAIEAFRGPIH